MLFNDPVNLQIEDGEVIYYPECFSLKEANRFFNILLQTIEWQQDNITLFGKTYLQPRLTALYANNNKPYSYSNITMKPKVFTKELLEIKQHIDKVCKTNFTTCLANLYRDGKDSNGWHADNEKELGKNPIIASVSFGEERMFYLKHKTNKSLKKKLILKSGSLLLMKGATQENWLHQVPKTKKEIGKRINLTFRIISN
ncbi:alpha-ketoglutarate-dependent dioxygenase AlkB [Oceanihabitans sp. 2_MG-2023]|uniref:alpha-ketoglutarate-dependent dioxygenase AlkB family protein n=1 Tax=Oceanihabitans sp. 2_MG-2023 TaxID=3062661 RepID=UPI0026E2D00C|nr:alpha-ketoglutarate-dependent dioxygenase AlkB [Oceanihabitans sp. 2_MG-2023]MDO6597590.1 alpha-ketoglutarate-dependent dioxygenase AlkB [Oceanihabitans sp. 2_MG-2023]